MKRFNPIILAMLLACGGTSRPAIPATPAIKADVARGQGAIGSASLGLAGAFQMKAAGAAVAAALQSGSFAGFDLSQGLATQGPFGVAPALPAGLTGITVKPAGCVRQDPASATDSILIAAGASGCTAADHVEVDYPNGDVANVTWTGSGASFSVSVSVAKGSWLGTSVSGSFSPGTVKGTVQFAASDAFLRLTQPVDADVDWTYTSTPAGDVSSSSRVTGFATDRIAEVRLTADVTSSRHQDSELVATVGVQGELTAELIDPSGAPSNTVAWLDVSTSTTSGAVSKDSDSGVFQTVNFAQGAVMWNGKQAGSFVVSQNHAVTAWTDGTMGTDLGAFGFFAVPAY